MIRLLRNKDEMLYPGDRDQIFEWIRRWGITDEQLTEAIIQTGSVNTRVLRTFLESEGLLFSFAHFRKRLFRR